MEDIVPLEHIQSGDVQIRVGGLRPYGLQAPVNIDTLTDYPSVRSIVTSTTMDLNHTLPHVEELITTLDAPSGEVLRQLPNLKRLHVGRMRGAKVVWLDTAALPRTLEALNVARHSLINGWKKKLPDDAPPRFTELAALTSLRRLTLRDCWPGDSVAPLTALTSLTHSTATRLTGGRSCEHWPISRRLLP